MRLLRPAGIIIGIWFVYGVLYAGDLMLRMPTYDESFNWKMALQWSMPDAIIWALLTPFPMILAWRFPIAWRHMPRNLVLHIVGFTLVASANVALDTLQNRVFGTSSMGFAGLFLHIFRETLLTKILIYGVIVFVQQQRDSLRRAREREPFHACRRA